MTTYAALLEVEEEASEEAMQEFDSMWWQMRRELDAYLDASSEYVIATKEAAQKLRDYTAHCSAGFSDLTHAYSQSRRAEKKAHIALKKAWTAVTASLGEMASKVVDGAMFDHLAVHDIRSLSPRSMLSKMKQMGEEKLVESICSGSNSTNTTLILQMATEALKKGLFGQTQLQLLVLFGETRLLNHF